MHIGKHRHKVNVSYELRRIAEEDNKAGDVLREAGLFRNAAYFYIQSMEKRVRSQAFLIVDPANRYWRETNQHHDLYSSVGFLIEALGMDTLVAKQVKDMINTYVIDDINFRLLHNSLRYPYYSEQRSSFSCVDYSEQDCDIIHNKLKFLINLLHDLNVYR